jgi:hypothetical protein
MVNGPGKIANLYNYEVVNKTFENQEIRFNVKHGYARLIWVGKEGFSIEPQKVQKGSFFIEFDRPENVSLTESIEIEIVTNGEVTDKVKSKFFFLPVPKQNN